MLGHCSNPKVVIDFLSGVFDLLQDLSEGQFLTVFSSECHLIRLLESGSVALILGYIEESVTESCGHNMVQVDFLSLEEAHVARDPHEHVLRDIDLHQDEQLEHRTEDVTHDAHVDPLTAVETKQVLGLAIILLVRDNQVSDDHGAG